MPDIRIGQKGPNKARRSLPQGPHRRKRGPGGAIKKGIQSARARPLPETPVSDFRPLAGSPADMTLFRGRIRTGRP
jgi:hypothetical protein